MQSRPATSTYHSSRTKSGRRYFMKLPTECVRATRKQIENQCSRMRVVVRAARTWTQLHGTICWSSFRFESKYCQNIVSRPVQLPRRTTPPVPLHTCPTRTPPRTLIAKQPRARKRPQTAPPPPRPASTRAAPRPKPTSPRRALGCQLHTLSGLQSLPHSIPGPH